MRLFAHVSNLENSLQIKKNACCFESVPVPAAMKKITVVKRKMGLNKKRSPNAKSPQVRYKPIIEDTAIKETTTHDGRVVSSDSDVPVRPDPPKLEAIQQFQRRRNLLKPKIMEESPPEVASTPPSGGLRFNLFSMLVSPKSKNHLTPNDDEVDPVCSQSPFSIRRIKAVKPSPLNMQQTNKKLTKKKSIGKRQNTDKTMSENEDPDSPYRKFSHPNNFPTSNPLNTSIYERLLRKKENIENNSYDSNSDTEMYGRRNRRLRLRKINNNTGYPVSLQKSALTNDREKNRKNARTNDKNNNESARKESSRASNRRKQWIAADRSSSKSSVDQPSSSNSPSEKRKHYTKKSSSQHESSATSKCETEMDAKPEELAVENTSSKELLSLEVAVEDSLTDSPVEMDVSMSPFKRSASLHSQGSAIYKNMIQRKTSQPQPCLDDSLPDLPHASKMQNNSASRLKRDYHITNIELLALREIIKKADLYDKTVRDRMYNVLKVEQAVPVENIASQVLMEKEVESLKQKLFMSRKELDSYISFTKKMEREKRQSISEKEELETKIQWHERRLTRFENENKSLKTERAELLNQIYELRGKSLKLKDAGHIRAKSMDVSLLPQPELEMSKQRLLQEADAFAQERTKLIKERQRLDDEVRKVQIKCVSLSAQLQHSEKTLEELKAEKEQLKQKLQKPEDDNSSQLQELDRKYTQLQDDYRVAQESRIMREHENMALRETVGVLSQSKEDSEVKLTTLEGKCRESASELKGVTSFVEDLKEEREYLEEELNDVSSRLSQLQHNAVQMEADQDAFKKFLDKLSMELQEKLGEEHVSKDKEADSLQEQAEMIGRQIVAHLNPTRKLQEDYEAIKQDREDLEEEVKYLKFALSSRMEIKNMQLPVAEKCECSKEKAGMKQELDDALSRLESLDSEVNRLHQDKQQLLMSFLNLQASQRSRDVSKSEMTISTDDDDDASGEDEDDEDTETEQESEDYDTDHSHSFTGNPAVKMSDENALRASLAIPFAGEKCPSCGAVETEELRNRLQEVLKTKERLESERVSMLDSLCKQVEENNNLSAEIDELKNYRSRPNSVLSKSDSTGSLVSEKCLNCASSGDEIRSYLSIIEELTEDKLRLEKTNSDLSYERERLQMDVERLNENFHNAETDLAYIGSEKESSVRAAKEESEFLLQNVKALEQENNVLEDNLSKLREDKTEILDKLRQAEEDRYGFIRTLSIITEQKEETDNELETMRQENEHLRAKLDCVESSSNSSKEQNDDAAHQHLGRSSSMPPTHHAVTSPRDHPIRRADLVDDISELDEDVDCGEEVAHLRKRLLPGNNKTDVNKMPLRRTSLEKQVKRKPPSRIRSVDFDTKSSHHHVYSGRNSLPLDEMLELIGNSKQNQAKTLSFQVTFNGVPVVTKNDF